MPAQQLSPKLQSFALSRNIGEAKTRLEGVNEMTYFLTSTEHSFPVYHLALGPEEGDWVEGRHGKKRMKQDKQKRGEKPMSRD